MTAPPRVGRLLMLGYRDPEPPAELFEFGRRFGLGGVILFRRNCPDAATVRRAITGLRRAASQWDPGRPLWVAVDQEGGRVERVTDGVPHLPPARHLGADLRGLAEAVAAQARGLRSLGFDVNLAPVCDVVQPGESGAIGDRSFGGESAAVARCVAAHVRACHAAGLAACAKHFPGHGSARVDSHRELPVLSSDRATLDRCDLVPFRAAIAAGVDWVMAGHLEAPAVAPEPATLSRGWLQEVLRGQLGFAGAIVSDDMEMGALAARASAPEVALEALRAGCDLLVYGRMLRPDLDLWKVAEALERELAPIRWRAAQARLEGGRLPR